MRLAAIALAALLAPAAAVAQAPAAPAAPAEPPVADVVAKMQAFYEKTKGFDTRFEQRFQAAGIPSRLGDAGAKGRMRFLKPSADVGPLMRWDYEDGRILLLVKDTSWTFDPDTKQAIQYDNVTEQLSAAVTFMWGKGKLAEEFEVKRASRTDLGEGLPVELVPKKPAAGFRRVFLVVDSATGMVRTSVVVQANGSENRIRFVDPKPMESAPLAEFDPKTAFPAGTTITRAAVPGR